MAKLVVWKDRAYVKKLLSKRLKQAKRTKEEQVQQEWRMARTCVYGNEFTNSTLDQYIQGVDTEDFDISDRIDVQYAFRNLRLIHSQMSSNPPVGTARAQSTDIEDRKATRAAQHCMMWFLQTLDMQNVNDLANLDCLVTGTGVTRTQYNPDGGEPIEFDETTEEMVTEGAIELDRVCVDNFWIDPHAKVDTDIRYTFELRQFTAEECKSRWPDKWPLIKRTAQHQETTNPLATNTMGTEMTEGNPEEELLYDLYWYYERGAPDNGFLGRWCVHTEDGNPIEGPDINPNLSYPPPPLAERRRALATGETLTRRPPTAYLPYQIVTDIDVPDRVWGRSALFYVAPAQKLMSNIDSAMLEMVKAHGVARLLLPAGAKMAKDSVSNTSVEIMQLDEDGQTGEKPEFIAPPGMPAGMTELRQNMRTGVDDMWGINENMFGQQSREQSAVNMQYAVNQGSLVRRRLFNKSIRFVQNQYKALMSLAIQHWDTPQCLAVLGQEQAYSVEEFANMDIYSGYEIDVEYGTHLPLDPMARRDELLKMMPIYQQVGVSNRSIASALRVDDLEYVESIGDLSRDRAQEIIDTIITKGIQVPAASKFQDHEGMLAYFLEYVNTADFDRLPQDRRLLIDDQINMRTQLAAGTRAAASGTGTPQPAAGAPSGPGGPPGQPAPGAGGSLPALNPKGAKPSAGPAPGLPGALQTPPSTAST